MFSLRSLIAANPGLSDFFIWKFSTWPAGFRDKEFLHIGCGEVHFDGFAHLDFVPAGPHVHPWNVLDVWPQELEGKIRGAFTEDVLEHFFREEQLYFLCSMNFCMKDPAVFRVLMPSLEALIDYGRNMDSAKGGRDPGWYETHMGAATGADAINCGMRMGGHRWLHNQTSIGLLATEAGFDAVATTTDRSTLPELSGRNRRTDADSTFANDLIRKTAIRRMIVSPESVLNAMFVEEVGPGQALYQAVTNDPQVLYSLPEPLLSPRQVALANFRSANLSTFFEHSYAKLYMGPSEELAIYVDSSMRSCPYMNLFSSRPFRQRLAESSVIDTLRFDPAERAGDYFTVGPMEIFFSPASNTDA